MSSAALAGTAMSPRARHARTTTVRPRDSVATFIGFALLTTFVVPDRYGFGPPGLRLSTTVAFGLVALIAWLTAAVFTRHPAPRFDAIRWTLIAYAGFVIFSAGVAKSRILNDAEANAVLRNGVLYAGYIGIGLVLTDGLTSKRGISRVINAILIGGYVSAIVAVAQRLFHFGYVTLWTNVPGLYTTLDAAQSGILLSGRAVGTGSHPIEFSVACAVLLPLAVTQSRFTETEAGRKFHIVGCALLVIGSLLGISRAGFIGLVVAVLLGASRLPVRTRINAAGFGFVMLVLVQFGAHGTLSTLRYQLQHVGSDQSSQGRESDYGPVFDLFWHRPWNGLGLGTFLPTQYIYLDNAWLGQLVTGGVIGVVALAALFLVGLYQSAAMRRLSGDHYLTEISHSLGIDLVILWIAAFFFDETSFPQTVMLIFACLGLIGACRRLARPGRAEAPGRSVDPSWTR